MKWFYCKLNEIYCVEKIIVGCLENLQEIIPLKIDNLSTYQI